MTARNDANSTPAAAGVEAGIAGALARWRLGVVALLSIATALSYWPTTSSLLGEWNNTHALTYTHGYVILAICLWLVIRNRTVLQAMPARADYRAAVALTACGVAWLISYRAGLLLIHQLLLPVIGWLAVWAALGLAVARRCAFAFGFLYFAIPIWSQGNVILQDATVVAVRVLLQLAGISAYVTGNVVHIPAGVFEIAGGCSGLHFFIVALAIAALYGELERDSPKVRLALLALAGIVAMLSNWVRVFTIILAGHLTNMQHYLIKVDHYYFGWGVFAIAMALFFVIACRIPVAPLSRPTAAAPKLHDPVSIGGLATALFALMVGPAWSLASHRAVDVAAAASGSLLPKDPGEWQGPRVDSGEWQPHYAAADVIARGEYRRAQNRVTVFVAGYADQRQGKELIGYDNSVLGAAQVELTGSRHAMFGAQRVKELELRDPQQHAWLLWYYYRIGSRRFSRDLGAQLYYGAASLAGPRPSLLIAARTQCIPDCAAARTILSDLVQALDARAETASVGP